MKQDFDFLIQCKEMMSKFFKNKGVYNFNGKSIYLKLHMDKKAKTEA